MRGNYTVAMCDILGFKNLVGRDPVDKVVTNHLGWLKKALWYALYKDRFPEDSPCLASLQNHQQLGMVWFSDTILMYTHEDNDEHLRALYDTLAWLFFVTMFKASTRLRCGVSYGEAVIDPRESIYVGQAIVDAYLLESRQEWAGGALTQAAVDRVQQASSATQSLQSLAQYSVPCKNGQHLDTLALHWPNRAYHRPDQLKWRWSATAQDPSEADYEHRPDIARKFENTKRFHDDVCGFCFSHNQSGTRKFFMQG